MDAGSREPPLAAVPKCYLAQWSTIFGGVDADPIETGGNRRLRERRDGSLSLGCFKQVRQTLVRLPQTVDVVPEPRYLSFETAARHAGVVELPPEE